MKTINVLGDTQAEQWKSVVHMLRVGGGCMDYKGRNALCSELDRYIDFAEKTMGELAAECEKHDAEKADIIAKVEKEAVRRKGRIDKFGNADYSQVASTNYALGMLFALKALGIVDQLDYNKVFDGLRDKGVIA